MMYIVRVLLGSIIVLLSGCSRDNSDTPPPPDKVVSIVALQLTPGQTRLPSGFEQQLIAQATLSDGSVQDLTERATLHWRSSNEATATITPRGLAKGLAPGNAIITASTSTAEGKNLEATAELAVTDAVVRALQVTPVTAQVPAGLAQPYQATAFFSDDSTLPVTDFSGLTWASSDNAIATASNAEADKGWVTGVAPGNVDISATGLANGASYLASAGLTVTNAVVTALLVTPASASVAAGLDQTFIAKVSLSDDREPIVVTDDPALTWRSSNETVATVSNAPGRKGVVTAQLPGTSTISAEGVVEGQPFRATAQLTVTHATVAALTLAQPLQSVPAGLEQQLTAYVRLTDGQTAEVTQHAALNWVSHDPTIATVSSVPGDKGRVHGNQSGTVTITASGTANGKPFSASTDVTISEAVISSLVITPAINTVGIGFNKSFNANAILSDGNERNVTAEPALSWTTDDPAIATIDDTGMVTGVAAGTVNITAAGSVKGQPFTQSAQLTVAIPDFSPGCAQGLVTTASGLTFTCAITQDEADKLGVIYQDTYIENGENGPAGTRYVLMNWSAGRAFCDALGGGYQIASSAALQGLFNEFGNMFSHAGWPTTKTYWSSTQLSNGAHYDISLQTGLADTNQFNSATDYISCVKS